MCVLYTSQLSDILLSMELAKPNEDRTVSLSFPYYQMGSNNIDNSSLFCGYGCSPLEERPWQTS